jgi:hypothetical protein
MKSFIIILFSSAISLFGAAIDIPLSSLPYRALASTNLLVGINGAGQASLFSATNFIGGLSGNLVGAISSTGTLGTVTISSRGIVNGLSSITNDGAAFGPDTVVAGVRTTTSGIQEAFDSIPNPIGVATNLAGAHLSFGPGDFFCTNIIVYSNIFVSNPRMEGRGYLTSRIIYAGASNGITGTPFAFVTIKGGGNTNVGSLNIPMHPEIENLCFMSITNTRMFLLSLTNCSNERVYDCNFTTWVYTTNKAMGPGVSIFEGGGNSLGSGVIGMQIGNVNDNQTIIENCVFSGLAGGMELFGDHVYCRNLEFAEIGHNLGSSTANIWPTTSVYSLGACIYRSTGIATHFDNCDFYSSNIGVANDSASGVGDFFFRETELEGTDSGWYVAFNTNATRLYLTSFDGSSEFVTGAGKINHSPYSLATGIAQIKISSGVWTGEFATNANRILGVSNGKQFTANLNPSVGLVITNGNLTAANVSINTNNIYVAGAGYSNVTANANGKYTWKGSTSIFIFWTNTTGCGIILDRTVNSLTLNTDYAFEITNSLGHIYGSDTAELTTGGTLFFPIANPWGETSMGSPDHTPPTFVSWGTNIFPSTAYTTDSSYLSGNYLFLPLDRSSIPPHIPRNSVWMWNSNGILHAVSEFDVGSGLTTRQTNRLW